MACKFGSIVILSSVLGPGRSIGGSWYVVGAQYNLGSCYSNYSGFCPE